MEKKFYTIPVTEHLIVNTSEMMQTDHVSNPTQGAGSGTSTDPVTPGAPKRRILY